MLSFYNHAMLHADDKDRRYLLEINTHGQIVVRPVDADGRPNGSFVAGDSFEVLVALAATISDRIEVKDYRGWVHPRYIVYPAETWREAADVLNGKPSVRRTEGRVRVRYLKWYREYLKARNDYDDPPFTLTVKALEYDREYLAKCGKSGTESS